MIEWKTISDLYEISNTGLVRNKATKKIRKQVIDRGYKRVTLYIFENGIKKLKTFSVHRLVAEAFLEKIEGKTEIDHINNCREDNRVENLRWVTHKENSNNPLSLDVKRIIAQKLIQHLNIVQNRWLHILLR